MPHACSTHSPLPQLCTPHCTLAAPHSQPAVLWSAEETCQVQQCSLSGLQPDMLCGAAPDRRPGNERGNGSDEGCRRRGVHMQQAMHRQQACSPCQAPGVGPCSAVSVRMKPCIAKLMSIFSGSAFKHGHAPCLWAVSAAGRRSPKSSLWVLEDIGLTAAWWPHLGQMSCQAPSEQRPLPKVLMGALL